MKRERPTDEELHRAVRNLNLELMSTEGYELAIALLEDDRVMFHHPNLYQWARDFTSSYQGLYRDIMEKDDAA
jgi:hypothetical protein